MNQRSAERIDTFLRAKIVIDDANPKIDCVIRDLSDVGAKIELDVGLKVPDRFDLDIPKKGRVYSVEQRWRYENRIGVRFIGSPEDAEAQSTLTRADLVEENARLRAAVRFLAARLAELGETVELPGGGETRRAGTRSSMSNRLGQALPSHQGSATEAAT